MMAVVTRRSVGRPAGSRDRNGRCNRADFEVRGTTVWRSFEAAFGHRISQLLAERDISVTELAAALGTGKTAVFNWCAGRSIPCLPVLVRVSVALSCSLVDLLPEQAHQAGGGL